jgi:hypothetical protein
MITLEKLQDFPPHKIFLTGIERNSESGIFMTRDYRANDWLRWVAVRGYIDDWAIYVGWNNDDENQIYGNGEKLTNSKLIRELVNCTDEVFARYRF